jgi:hypothetical protein
MKSTLLLILQLNGVRSGNAGTTVGGRGALDPPPAPFLRPWMRMQGVLKGERGFRLY